MRGNTQHKMLVKVDVNSIFYKVKKFFSNLFQKKEVNNNIIRGQEISDGELKNEHKKNDFVETIRNIEDDETRLLKLQKQYRAGKIKEEELSSKQKNSLCVLYDRQFLQHRYIVILLIMMITKSFPHCMSSNLIKPHTFSNFI